MTLILLSLQSTQVFWGDLSRRCGPHVTLQSRIGTCETQIWTECQVDKLIGRVLFNNVPEP